MSTRRMTVREALQYVADYPQPVDDEIVVMPTSELVARTLYDIANKPDAQVKGSMTRANKARKMILNRLAGRRRAGTAPALPTTNRIIIRDLMGEVDSGDGA